MDPFEHYMYVLECADGTLYTGYAPDVEARVDAHNKGRGAKYTKSHLPVRLVAKARFYSKKRAMSAEAHFKKLNRQQKDALLAKAKTTPFEEVLRVELPGFGNDTAEESVRRSVFEHIDLDYKAFHTKLVPNVDPKRIAGVRTPELKKISKALAKRGDASAYFKALPHQLFDENQVHAFAIGQIKDYDLALEQIEAFLPHIDNWATCDQLPVKMLAKDPDRTLEKVQEWLESDHCYTIRFGIGVLMRLYLDDLFEPRFLDWVADARMPFDPGSPTAKEDEYYVNMMRAWYFAEALAKQEAAALPYLERRGEEAMLDEWTRRKGIQKAIESRRISDELKVHLRECR